MTKIILTLKEVEILLAMKDDTGFFSVRICEKLDELEENNDIKESDCFIEVAEEEREEFLEDIRLASEEGGFKEDEAVALIRKIRVALEEPEDKDKEK